ncbi:hypothetical protein Baya_13421 [Bagarius yarrelli]|uniref:Uncharacterized protein n=1 Tax=Bagarius yarrelli TaxID=175774 RepID=A0A556V5J2_BAGYA|nr:hypothetical protein Baya_13421 [Bagarius yarrelli]
MHYGGERDSSGGLLSSRFPRSAKHTTEALSFGKENERFVLKTAWRSMTLGRCLLRTKRAVYCQSVDEQLETHNKRRTSEQVPILALC